MNLKKGLLLLNILTISCSSGSLSSRFDSKSESIYQDKYESLKISEELFFAMPEDNYGVYLYSSYCVTCERMKEFLYSYIDRVDEKELTKLYLFNISENEETFKKFKQDSNLSYEEAINNMRGSSSITELYFYYTPSIYFIKNNQIDNAFFDTNDIFNYLTSI